VSEAYPIEFSKASQADGSDFVAVNAYSHPSKPQLYDVPFAVVSRILNEEIRIVTNGNSANTIAGIITNQPVGFAVFATFSEA